MKNFKNYTPEKYATSDFQKIEEGIYKTKSRYSVVLMQGKEILLTRIQSGKLQRKLQSRTSNI